MRPAEIKQIRFTTRCGLHDSAGEIHDLTQRSLMASRRHSESNLNPYQFPRDLAAASQTDSLFRGRSRPLRSGHPTDRAPCHPPGALTPPPQGGLPGSAGLTRRVRPVCGRPVHSPASCRCPTSPHSVARLFTVSSGWRAHDNQELGWFNVAASGPGPAAGSASKR